MADEFFTDMLSTKMTINSVAGVANMSTTSHIVWVKNIQTDNLSSICLVGNACVSLGFEKGFSCLKG